MVVRLLGRDTGGAVAVVESPDADWCSGLLLHLYLC